MPGWLDIEARDRYIPGYEPEVAAPAGLARAYAHVVASRGRCSSRSSRSRSSRWSWRSAGGGPGAGSPRSRC